MRLDRVFSKRRNRAGYRYRFLDPITRQRCHKTFWFSQRALAEMAVRKYLDYREAVKHGIEEEV